MITPMTENKNIQEKYMELNIIPLTDKKVPVVRNWTDETNYDRNTALAQSGKHGKYYGVECLREKRMELLCLITI